ncbi:hypothetical protein C1D09_003895 [Mesorhizobium intechi]|uniref:hypothetical protein n=1 Tax=Mesorhizobium intechi TaxID=537601 RepID=UPI000CC3E9B7|nr:hypothetical protein [Mesorhizobium intechi]TSE13465.1 hypothetical protein C1D09_003895 [Mesorhizobium intechi]
MNDRSDRTAETVAAILAAAIIGLPNKDPISDLIGPPGAIDFGSGAEDLGAFDVPGASESQQIASRRMRLGRAIFRILIWREPFDAK